MTREEALEKILGFYEAYYDIKRTDPMPPFAAEALFTTHSEEYFLIKEAKITEYDSEEYVYFAIPEHLTLHDVVKMERIVWTETLRRANPKENHRSSDGVIIILADQVDDDAAAFIARLRRFKSYFFGLHGSSTIRMIAKELSTGDIVYNRHGNPLEKILRNI